MLRRRAERGRRRSRAGGMLHISPAAAPSLRVDVYQLAGDDVTRKVHLLCSTFRSTIPRMRLGTVDSCYCRTCYLILIAPPRYQVFGDRK